MRSFVLSAALVLVGLGQAQAQDAAAGEKTFAQCRACHQVGENAKNAVAPQVVAKAVEHALTAKRPRTRYLVGKDAKAVGTLGRFLPDRALDAIVAKITKLS